MTFTNDFWRDNNFRLEPWGTDYEPPIELSEELSISESEVDLTVETKDWTAFKPQQQPSLPNRLIFIDGRRRIDAALVGGERDTVYYGAFGTIAVGGVDVNRATGGVVDYVRTMYEGAQFDTDTFLVKSGSLPANVSYAAHVQVTRIEPEEYLPPQPGDPVNLAVDEDLKRALHFDGMEKRIPAGTMRNSCPAYLNYEFINGEKGAHINISGVSGVATKTSYALFLLHSIFNSAALGAQRANTKALIFNVKGEDLFFLDKFNSKLRAEDYANYQTLGVPVEAFKDVRFCAAPRKGTHDVDPHLDQRPDNVSVYLWSIRELCRDRLFSFLFAGEDLERGNLGFLVSGVEEKLARLAEDNDRADKKANRKLGVHLEVEPFGALDKQEVETFRDLIEFLEDKLVENPDNSWLGRNAPATAEALIRRLWGINNEMGHLIRGDLPPERMTKYQLDPLSDAHRLTVVDINKLGGKAVLPYLLC